LDKNNIDHFLRLRYKRKTSKYFVYLSKYQTQIQLFFQSFKNRFQDFEKDKKHFAFPLSITFNEILKYSSNIQLEITEIQKPHFHEVEQPQHQSSEKLIKFWKLVPKEDFLAIYDLALQILSRFGSTICICEKVFSELTNEKN